MTHVATEKGGSKAKSGMTLGTLDCESQHKDRLEALSALIKISTAIGFMPMRLKEALQFLVEETKKVFDVYYCAVFLLAEAVDFKLVFAGPPGLEGNPPKGCHQQDCQDMGKCLVVRDELPCVVQDTTFKGCGCGGIAFDENVSSYACLPITTGKKLVGVLSICSTNREAFSQDHLEMMLLVATMAASAIQKSQLFNNLEAEKIRLERANKKISKLNSDLKTKIMDLKKAQSQIVQTEKLAVAGRLAAGVAHEVNNPIGIIINRIECIQSEAKAKGVSLDLIQDLATISKYTHRISKIVEDLSIFSRTTYSEPEFVGVDINDTLANVLFLVEQKIDAERIRLHKQLNPERLFIKADSDRLEQVFINIIDNAVDSIKGKGTVIVSSKIANNRILIEISDSGKGMSEKEISKIFDPFFTTKEVGKGTGLGLSISQAIIKDHSAGLTVESHVNKGSTFTISFPQAPEFLI